MERWRGRVALVTGASAGIGAEICRTLVSEGMSVVGCARNLRRIQEMAEEERLKGSPGTLHPVRCDLSSESEIASLFSEIRDRFGRVDVCVNNAGFSTDSPLITGDARDWNNMLQVNVLALCLCSREAVKLMMEKGIDDGQIIHIGSIGGHVLPDASLSMSGFHFYCATKFMVRALAEGLRREIRDAHAQIRVACVSPGIVETEFLQRALRDEEAGRRIYASLRCLRPEDVAEAVLHVLRAPPHVDTNDLLIRPTQ